MDEVQAAHPDLVVAEGGVSTEKELQELFKSQLARAGLIAIPLTIGILLLVMGTGLGALIPVFVGLTSVLATMGLVSLPSSIVPMDAQIAEVILLVGLAVGVDYSIFYMRRERDERRAGRSEGAALEAAAATSGRAVLISGFTVMGAMAGMFLSGNDTFMSFAIGSMMVVGVAMIGSLTVLPAMLAALGDRVHRTHLPFFKGRARREAARAEAGQEGSRIWGAILRPVLRHPVISTIAATAVLVVLALPALAIHPAESGLDAMPKSEPSLEAFHVIEDAFPGGASQAVIAVRSDDAQAAEAQIDELTRQALATGEIHEPIDVERSPDGSTYQVSMALAGEGTDAASDHALATLRNEIIPATIGTLPNAEYGVTGGTAASRDFTGLDEGQGAARVRRRDALRLRDPAARLPVDHRGPEGDHPEPAVGGRRLRRHGRRVPVGLGREPARLQLHRRHRLVAPDVPVRDPVRPLDGLPRVHPEQGPRALRPRHEHP